MRKRLAIIFVILVALSLGAAFFDYDPLWTTFSHSRKWSLGLDLAGGSYLIYDIDTNQVNAADRDSVVRGLRDVIEKRVNLFGVSEPRVYTEAVGDRYRLIVELAGVKEMSEAIKEIGATPFLDFREVFQSEEKDPEDSSGNATTTAIKFVPTALKGRYVKGAQLGFDSVARTPQVLIEFDSEGAKIFEELTARNVGKPLAIFLDNELIEMPTVSEKIAGGKAQITGRYTVAEAKMLVERFNAGALPAPITLVNQQTINADFGKDALDKAVFAGMIGTAVIIIFMLFYYRELGIFASVALLMYIALTLAIFKVIPITMTLAGIAGFILSIGMAVDANILVFERTKEEFIKGLSRAAAIEEGFRRAWTSIRDSNISTMITAAVLYYFTSSFVQGFALTLFIGVVVSMFSAITITRTMLRIFMKHTPGATHTSHK
ncbi:protein translocase subunit SecD [Candidatus Jorgensenbacteria bacterium]|nr:protein translocase subunit SecD [Candidatus Jorgensenbacteria bacterium]